VVSAVRDAGLSADVRDASRLLLPAASAAPAVPVLPAVAAVVPGVLNPLPRLLAFPREAPRVKSGLAQSRELCSMLQSMSAVFISMGTGYRQDSLIRRPLFVVLTIYHSWVKTWSTCNPWSSGANGAVALAARCRGPSAAAPARCRSSRCSRCSGRYHNRTATRRDAVWELHN